MSHEVKQAVESIKPLAHGYKAVLVIAEALEKIGDLDNARVDAERRLADARQQLDKAVKARDAALEEANAHRSRAGEVMAEAKAIAAQVRNESQAAAEQRKVQSGKDAADIVDLAKMEARQTVIKAENEAKRIVDGALRSKADIDALREQAEQALAGVRAELQKNSEELAHKVAKIDQARAEARRIMGHC